MSLLGIEVGTTGCKVIAFREDGEILAQAYGEYQLIHPQPGWSELDSNVVWENVSSGIREVAAQTKSDPIEAISVASQGEAVTPISGNCDVLANAITTFDSRTTGICEEILQDISPLEVMQITGMPPSNIHTLAKLVWIQRNHPEIYKEVWKFFGFEDFVNFRLGVQPAVDYSLAARTMCFDIINKCWSEKMLGLADVDVSLLPDTVPSGTIIGEIGTKVSGELGLPKGVVVVAGGHDQPCGALGAGIIRGGELMDATGTVECIAPAFDEPVINQQMIDGNFACYPHVVDGLYVTLGFVSSGGVVLRWFRDTLAQAEVAKAAAEERDVYDILLEDIPETPGTAMLLPHFTGSGTPHLDLESKGAIVGLTLSTTKGELVKAILEGISYEIKQNLTMLEDAGVEINEVRAIGGGAKSEKWLQLKADMFNKKVIALDISEGVCLGTAILSGTAIGKYSSIEEAVDLLVKSQKVYYPREEIAQQYDEKLKVYEQIYPALRDLNDQL
ncbi:MAG: FGGY family carbohydrate kinase [Candidatus Poribacteria bacterium]|nr:FGGY family carbohydrate kinase [Candidatus Poribacteria bacterium]